MNDVLPLHQSYGGKRLTARRICRPPTRRVCRRAGEADTLTAIVADYRRAGRNDAIGEARYFGEKEQSFAGALQRACLGEMKDGTLHPHQRRIGRTHLQGALPCLLPHADAIGHASSFGELHDLVERAIAWKPRIGELAVYDVAQRIGWYLGIEPQLVYLHAGTREGVRALGIAAGGKTLDLSLLPTPFNSLAAAEAEDILCLYKYRFRTLL